MKDHEKVAHKFGQHIVQQAWESAHSLLSSELQSAISPRDIERKIRSMISYTDDEISEAEVVYEMEDWPNKKDNDIGWVYVSLSGDTFVEGVTVVVQKENSKLEIRSIEWGRP